MLGRSVGNYRLISKIGQGGMGVVYLAQHKTLGRRAAVKVLVPELSSNQDIVSRFFNEARATTAIRNPGIVEVFDFGFLDDRSAYIVMEYLDGESLAARIRKARPKVVATLGVLRAIARPLQAVHELGIVHRDLKPDNVFLVPDADMPSGERIKLLDFGIAKLNAVMGQTGHTKTGTVMGTPTYMAPEQCRGAGSVDHRADLYALGCIAYEMLCGQPPFVAEGAGEIIARHLYFEPARPRTLRASLRPEVEELVLRLLQKDPAARPSTAAEVIHVIDRLVANAPTVAPRIEPADQPAAGRRRRSEPLGSPLVVGGTPIEPMAAAGQLRSEPMEPPVAAARPRSEPSDTTVAAGRRHSAQVAQPVAAGRPQSEPADPTVAAGQRGKEPLAQPVAVRPRSEPGDAPVVGVRPRSEPGDSPVVAVRPRSEAVGPPVAPGQRRNEPSEPPVASDRSRSEPVEPPSGRGRLRDEPAAPKLVSGRQRSEPADPPVAPGRQRMETLDLPHAAHRPRNQHLDRPVVSPRSAKMDTTLSGAVAVNDVSTSAPTLLRSRFTRVRVAAGTAAAIGVLLAVVAWTHSARSDQDLDETPSTGTHSSEREFVNPSVATQHVGTGNTDQVDVQPAPAPPPPATSRPQPAVGPSAAGRVPPAAGPTSPAAEPTPPAAASSPSAAGPTPLAARPTPPAAEPVLPAVAFTPPAATPTPPAAAPSPPDPMRPHAQGKHRKAPPVLSSKTPPLKTPPDTPPSSEKPPDSCARIVFAAVLDATTPSVAEVQAALAHLQRCKPAMDASTFDDIQGQLINKL
jgi:serine/threonine-protein kinase